MPTMNFRPLVSSDYPLLLDWLQRSHVKEWWDDGDDTLENVSEHYSTDPDTTKRFIVELAGEPVGFIQYALQGEERISLDLFLAQEEQLSHGHGTDCLKAFVALVADRESVALFTVDPHPRNKRAIRCYEKCGFQVDPVRSTPSVCLMSRPS